MSVMDFIRCAAGLAASGWKICYITWRIVVLYAFKYSAVPWSIELPLKGHTISSVTQMEMAETIGQWDKSTIYTRRDCHGGTSRYRKAFTSKATNALYGESTISNGNDDTREEQT